MRQTSAAMHTVVDHCALPCAVCTTFICLLGDPIRRPPVGPGQVGFVLRIADVMSGVHLSTLITDVHFGACRPHQRL